MMSLRSGRRHRRVSLTPMIDVVFLLLVFFMLAARFGIEGALDLRLAGGGAAEWIGPPRLVDVGADTVRLNGVSMTLEALPDALSPLMPQADATVVLRPGSETDVARLVAVMEALGAAGLTNIAVTE